MKSNKYIWFTFLSLSTISYPTPKALYIWFSFWIKMNFQQWGEWENGCPLPDRLVQLPDCDEQSNCGHLGHGQPVAVNRQILRHTFSLHPHLEPGCDDTRLVLKIQQPVVISRTRSSNFYLSVYLWGLIQPAFGKEWCNFPPPSLSVQGQPLFYECTPWSGCVNLYKTEDSGSQSRNPP